MIFKVLKLINTSKVHGQWSYIFSLKLELWNSIHTTINL